MFVRGGDVAETRVFINEAVVLAPYKNESPTGGFFGAFDPFPAGRHSVLIGRLWRRIR